MKDYEHKEMLMAEAIAAHEAKFLNADVASHRIYASLGECMASYFLHGEITKGEAVLNALGFAIQEARDYLIKQPVIAPDYSSSYDEFDDDRKAY
jgi:hypothetical protein